MRKASEYVELHCHSAFSLLDGAALPEMLVARAANLGYSALALTDHDELGGAVRFAQAGSELGIGAIIGAELTFSVPLQAHRAEGTPSTHRRPQEPFAAAAENDVHAKNDLHHLVLLAETREGYGNLSTLITHARMQSARGEPSVDL